MARRQEVTIGRFGPPCSAVVGALGLFVAAAFVVSPAAMRAQLENDALAQSAEADQLGFAWPVPGSVVVTVHSVRERTTTLKQVRLEWEKDPTSPAILVHRRDPKILNVNDEPVTPEMEAMLAPILLWTSAVPSMRIDEDGKFREYSGSFDSALEELTRRFDEVDELRQIGESPQLRHAVESRGIDMWNFSVGLWAGLELAPGDAVDLEVAVPMFGPNTNQPITVRHMGRAKQCPACIRLRAEGVIEGESLRDALLEVLQDLMAQSGQTSDYPLSASQVRNVRREVRASIVTDSQTLRPIEVTLETRVMIDASPDVLLPAQQVERDTYRFAWPDL